MTEAITDDQELALGKFCCFNCIYLGCVVELLFVLIAFFACGESFLCFLYGVNSLK